MWQVKAGHLHNHVDGRTLMHNIHLFNSVTGGEHNLQLMLRIPSCAVCHRPFAKAAPGAKSVNQYTRFYADPSEFDPAGDLEDTLALLNPHHEAVLQYSRKHSVPILLGNLASSVPAGHRLVKAADRRLLVPPPRESK